MNKHRFAIFAAVAVLAFATLACSLVGSKATEVPTQAPAPTQAQAQPTSAPVTGGGTVEVVDQSFYTDSYGDVQVYGLVKNNSDRAVSSIELTIEAKDAGGNTVLKDYDGSTLATDTIYTMSSNLFPGETTPFTYYIDGDNGVPATVNVVATGSLSSDETRVNVTVENVEFFASDGSYYVSGELINNGSSAAKVEDLSAAIFDGGKVVAADWSSTYAYYLAPNGDEGGMDRSPFVVSIYGPEGDYSDYQVFIDAVETDFVAIPEIYVDLPYAYFGDWGSFHVIGTLENATSEPYSVYLVTGLYAEDGTVLDAVSHSSPLYIAPGAKIAFDSTYFSVVGWEDAQTDKLDNYTVQLDPYWTYEAGYELVSPQTFTVTEARDGNAWNFSGEMTNDTGEALSWMTLQVNVYDGETLVATEYYSMYPEEDAFAAGSKASYDLDLDLDPGLADVDLTYEIITQGIVK